MRKILEILTPENVYLEYELSGLGSRFVAFLIDSLIQLGLIVLIVIGMALGQFDFEELRVFNLWITAIGIILLFLIFFGYFIVFELVTKGRSPGKKAMGLRVIKENGEPIGFWESFMRNILRIADFLPSLNLLGAVFIVFSPRYKRIGDFAANTVVVKVRKGEKPVELDNLIGKAGNGVEAEELNIYPVNNFEYNLIKEFISRKSSLGDREKVFVYHLNKYFMEKFNLEKPSYESPYEFFEDIVRKNSR